MIFAAAISIGIFVIYFVIGIYFYSVTVQRNTNQGESRYNRMVDEGLLDPDFLGTLVKEDFSLESPRGYTLLGNFFLSESEPENIIVLVHGIGGDRWSLMNLAEMYTDLGFSLAIFDMRAHGASGGSNTTYGYYEHQDLELVVNLVHQRFPEAKLGVHGESLGGATVAMYSELHETKELNQVDFFVLDAPYSDLWELFTLRLKEDYGFPNLGIVESGSTIARIVAGFGFDQVSPIRSIATITKPVLFIHGSDDLFVPTHMSEDLFAVKPGEKMLHLVPGAEHANSFETNPEGYKQILTIFLTQKVGYPLLRIE